MRMCHKIFFLFLIFISKTTSVLLPDEFVDKIIRKSLYILIFNALCYTIIGFSVLCIAACIFQLIFSYDGVYRMYRLCYICWKSRKIPDDDDDELDEVKVEGGKYVDGSNCKCAADLIKRTDQLRIEVAQLTSKLQIVLANLAKCDPPQG
ncbi:hypothetical protein XENTR_v10020863 [Xenopus tropicalis]|nr:hypothetical protein XENTR_v10020863 [Xenopus tropicalis]